MAADAHVGAVGQDAPRSHSASGGHQLQQGRLARPVRPRPAHGLARSRRSGSPSAVRGCARPDSVNPTWSKTSRAAAPAGRPWPRGPGPGRPGCDGGGVYRILDRPLGRGGGFLAPARSSHRLDIDVARTAAGSAEKETGRTGSQLVRTDGDGPSRSMKPIQRVGIRPGPAQNVLRRKGLMESVAETTRGGWRDAGRRASRTARAP